MCNKIIRLNSLSYLVSLGLLIYTLLYPTWVHFLSALILIISTFILFLFKPVVKEDIFSPLVITVIALVLGYGIKAILGGEFFNYREEHIIYALLWVLLFITFFVAGLFVSITLLKRDWELKCFSVARISYKRSINWLIFSPAVAIIIFIILTHLVLKSWNFLSIFYNPLKFGMILSMQGLYYIKFLIRELLVSPLLLWSIIYFTNKGSANRLGKNIKLLLALNLILLISWALMMGARSSILFPFFSLMIIYNCLRKRISVSTIIFVLLFVIPFSYAYLSYRNALFFGQQKTEIGETVITVIKNTDFKSSIQHFINRFSLLEELISFIEFPDKRYLYGKSIIYFLMQPIPRAIYPQKPYLFNMEMTREIEPEFFTIGGGSSYGMIPELFLNWHLVGIIIGGVVFGWIIGIFQFLYNANKRNPFFVLIYSRVALTPWGWICGGLINSSANELLILSIMFYLILYKYLRKRNA